ncbi:DUF7507 domain-containing protein [Xylanimonas allomyrinae]|uniref:DUF7507 domain-containing protein n=1 Tax=Xylanimonas allomyrinae TaxID=2509459 RepID=UPI0013A66ABB|nr:hypothetical protein [Xylanimonas allomyrinae]
MQDLPATYKFGLVSSTGNAGDVHLVRNLAIGTVNPLTGLTLVKAEDNASPLFRPGGYAEGDKIPYTIVVSNFGEEAVNDLVVSDPLIDDLVCPSTRLAAQERPGASITCTGTHTLTASEATNPSGTFVNAASAAGTSDLGGGPVTSDVSTATVRVVAPVPALAVVKRASVADVNRSGVTDAGDVVSYSFEVTNTGNVTLAPVTVSDGMLGLVDAACAGVLAPDESVVCAATGSRTVTEADLGAPLVNTVTATGVPPEGSGLAPVEALGVVSSEVADATTGLVLVKSAVVDGPDQIGDVGEVVRYEFDVTNTGTISLAPVVVDDPGLGLVRLRCAEVLAPGASARCAGGRAHTVTEGDLVAGRVTNTATATGVSTRADVPDPEPVTSTAVVETRAPVPALAVVKRASVADVNRSGVTDAGDVVSYSFEVTNTGNVTLAPVTVSDGMLGLVDAACAGVLAPDESVVCAATGSRTVTEADLGAPLVNTVTATGVPPEGSGLAPVEALGVVSSEVADATTGLVLVKSAVVDGPDQIGDVGEVVRYEFDVTNTGTISLAPVVVDDPGLGLVRLRCAEVLAPGASARCAGGRAHTVTEGDLVAGRVTNTATATGVSTRADVPDPEPVTSTAVVETRGPVTGLTVVKRAALSGGNGLGVATVGNRVSYSFEVTNTGNVTLAPVTVSDGMLGLVDAACAGVLAPGESVVCTATGTHTVSEEDARASRVRNTVTATGVPPAGAGDPVTSADTVETPVHLPPLPAPLPPRTTSPTAAQATSLATASLVVSRATPSGRGASVHTGGQGSEPAGSVLAPLALLAVGMMVACPSAVVARRRHDARRGPGLSC